MSGSSGCGRDVAALVTITGLDQLQRVTTPPSRRRSVAATRKTSRCDGLASLVAAISILRAHIQPIA
jgi:hypothetical protein